jgi:hypothetical protein
VQFESQNYDLISGVPYETPFTDRIDHILKQREVAQRCNEKRKVDPICGKCPTPELEEERSEKEAEQRQREIEYWEGKMSPNERRAKRTLANILTGEVKDPNAASAIQEFPTKYPRRAEIAVVREKEIVKKREDRTRTQTAKVGCRYNNGRMKEVRDWDIISGREMEAGWDESVKMKPSPWEWCNTEWLSP